MHKGKLPIRPLGRFALERLFNLLFAYPTDTWEFAASLLAAVWGLWVVCPAWNTFEPDLYWVFLEVGPEWAWGLGGTFVGTFGFLALFLSKWSAWRVAASFLKATFWFTVAYGMTKGVWETTATPVYYGFALLSALTAVRLFMYRESSEPAKANTLARKTAKDARKAAKDAKA